MTHLTEEILHGIADGTLAAAARAAAEAHLALCAECRADVDALRALVVATRALPREIAPERDLWPGIAGALARRGTGDGGRRMGWRVPLLLAATVVLALSATLWLVTRDPAAWRIVAASGAARVDGAVARGGAIRAGQRLETGAGDSLHLSVGRIGTVALAPGTRARLVVAAPDVQRLALERGTIHAEISAPPRVFVVETPAAVATDLGCVYTLTVDADGNGLLRVTSGWVELARDGRLVVVPWDAQAPIRSGYGPGTPVVADAPAALLAALGRFDFGAGGAGAVRAALAAARPADAVSVLNLLPRTDGDLRATVYDRLAALVPPPPGTTRAATLALEPRVLDRWWDAVRPPRLDMIDERPLKKRIRLFSD
jgi:anti-sigma factor RsiW